MCLAAAANNRLMTMSALFSFAYLKSETQLVLISPQVRASMLKVLDLKPLGLRNTSSLAPGGYGEPYAPCARA